MATLTWLGHAAFRIDTDAGKRIYVDPFLEGNPSCPEAEQQPERCDLILLTHGHDDHVGGAVEIATKFDCPVVAQVELRGWLSTRGLPEDMTQAMNKGGTRDFDGVSVTLTNAHHSSSGWVNGPVYTGESCGLVVGVDGRRVYIAGDTCVFGDMSLIARLYEPDLVVLPIGDHFTMGPKEAALALELLGAKRCVPSHYGTFPLLTGTVDELRQLAPGVQIEAPEPGGSVEI